jgi:oligopeptidase B
MSKAAHNKAPKAARRRKQQTRHGIARIDHYAWLKDDNWQAVMQVPEKLDREIREYLEAENAYTETWLADTETLRADLFAEMRARIKEDDASVPATDGDFEYYVDYVSGGQHPRYCRRPLGGGEAGAEILLDGDFEAEGEAYFNISGAGHSPDHRLFAYAADRNGSERYAIQVGEIGGAGIGAAIEGARGDFAWANDSKTLFYTELDDNHRPWCVKRLRLGDDPAAAAMVFEEKDAGFFVSIGKSQSNRFIEITAHDHTTTEVHLIDADAPDAPPTVVEPRHRDREYSIAHMRFGDGERFYILTNADGAEDFKIVEAPLEAPGHANWQDVIAHQAGRLIRSMAEFSGHLARLERIDGLPRIIIRDLASGAEHAIEFDEEAYELGLLPGYEFSATSLRFTYSSMTTPRRTFDYDMVSRSRVLRKQQEVPSGHDAGDYITKRLFAKAADGAMVPISLLARADTPMDGSAPLLLYGYGSYGMAMPASFSTNRLSLVDRGFIYAIAHIRGGTERGYGWYLDGKLDKKPNTFNDFIAAAEHLIASRLASPGRIAIHGGSAGGMLVGAAANMRPDLWGAAVGEVPFVDVLNTMCDKDLPLTPPEWPEWGNPIEDAAAYATIRSYSPYDNVAARDYPPILATAGLTDPRVTYWEPAKWVAKLRHLKTDNNPLLLRTNMEAGHGGASGRFDYLDEVAIVYGFLLKVFGMAK